jgi:hypothetical protein
MGAEVLLLGTSDAAPARIPANETWIERFDNAPTGGLYACAELAHAGSRPDDTSVVYGRWDDEMADGGRLDSLAVLAVKRRRPPLTRVLTPLYPVHGLRLVGDHLFGDNSAESIDWFLHFLAQLLAAKEFTFILFEDLEVDSPLWTQMVQAVRTLGLAVYHPWQTQPHWWIDFPADPATYWQRFHGKTWYDVRSKARKLKHILRCFNRPEDLAEFLAKAHDISNRSWQGKRLGCRIRNSPEERDFLEFVASRGALRCYILEHDERPLAFEMATQWKGLFTFIETGYDLEYGRYSPGMVLFLRLLEDLTAHDPPRACDFGFGDSDYKQFFGTRHTQSGPVLLVRRWSRPAMALHIEQAVKQIARGFREKVKNTNLYRYCRRAFRT